MGHYQIYNTFNLHGNTVNCRAKQGLKEELHMGPLRGVSGNEAFLLGPT